MPETFTQGAHLFHCGGGALKMYVGEYLQQYREHNTAQHMHSTAAQRNHPCTKQQTKYVPITSVPSSYDGKTRKPVVNTKHMGETFWRTSGWDGNHSADSKWDEKQSGREQDTEQDTVQRDGRQREQKPSTERPGTRGREQKTTWFPVSVPCRSRPNHIFPPRLLARVALL